MKKFTKLALALLLTASVAALATGCNNNPESVLYRSAAGDEISGTKLKDSLDVFIDIKDPSNPAKSIAGGNTVIHFEGSELFGQVGLPSGFYGGVLLDGGTMSDTAITYSSVTYTSSQNDQTNQPSWPTGITFIKQ